MPNRHYHGLALAVVLLLGSACDKAQHEPVKREPKPNKPPVTTSPPAQHSPAAKPYTCRADRDCVVSCAIANNCCGELCGCTNVYHLKQLAKLEAANRASCTKRMVSNCPVAKCEKPVTQLTAMCHASGKCVGVRVPFGTKMVDGFFTLPNSPPPRACTAASDCLGDTVPTASGCCNDPRTLRAYSRAYKRFVHDWRTSAIPGGQTACAHVKCQIPPPPSLPPRCRFTMRCVNKLCADSCPGK